LCGVVTSQGTAGWSVRPSEVRGRADIQDMTSNDEPIYETVMREHNWDPERCEPLSLTTLVVGRYVA
jgi:hypothetical protein